MKKCNQTTQANLFIIIQNSGKKLLTFRVLKDIGTLVLPIVTYIRHLDTFQDP